MTTPVTVRPVTAQIENSIRTIGGISTTDLAKQFDTPLYIMDVATVRNNCRHYTDSLKALNVDYTVAYAGKAGMCFKLLNLLAEEGLGTDVVSGGEIHTVLQTNIDRDKIYFHGNNKSKKELEMAIEAGIRIVIDNAYELQLIDSITKETGKQAQLLIRLKPEIEAHTHEHIQTGQIESKFGVSKAELIPMIQTILDAPNLQFLGIHGHIGSQIFDPIPYEKLAHLMMDYLIKIKQDTQAPVLELNLGGGIGIPYIEADKPPVVSDVITQMVTILKDGCAQANIPLPRIIVEPGRSIVATAGATLYSAGALKSIPVKSGTLNYVFVDGGMADNLRYALYKSEYTFEVANKADHPATTQYTIAGKFCESGDKLGENIPLPQVESGDLVLVYGTGAYNYAMASHYNLFPYLAMVGIEDGVADLWIERETYEDLNTHFKK